MASIDESLQAAMNLSLRELTVSYGFSRKKALAALEATGSRGDTDACVNWLLDHGEPDQVGQKNI